MPGLQVFKLFMAFLRTSLTVLTTCARIMCIWCTLVIKNLSSIKGFSEHYKICLTQDGWPPREIKLGITSANLLQYCFSRIVPEMAINCKVLYKTVCRLTQKNIEVPKHFMGFLRTLVTAHYLFQNYVYLVLPVAINSMEPLREIKLPSL